MNKKRKVDDVLESIFNLIQDAHKELKESEKNDQNHNNLLIEKEKSINIHKSLIKEKIVSNSKSRDGDWSNLNFKRIEFTKIKILLIMVNLQKSNRNIGFLMII